MTDADGLGGPPPRRFDRVSACLLAALLALLAAAAYYPFDWSPPRAVDNDVRRTAAGTLRFGEDNVARTPGTPAWVADARDGAPVRIDLRVRPAFPQRYAPVSILMVARDFWHTDIGIDQDGRNLVVSVGRPGATENGDPPFVVDGAFGPGRWTAVRVVLERAAIVVAVDGTTRVREPLPAGYQRSWDGGRLALGDEVHGGHGWQGEIARAEVRTPNRTVDYVRPGALDVPAESFYLPDHVAPFPPISRLEWAILALHLLSFVPVGFLVARLRRPPFAILPVTALAAGFAALLALGKFGFDGRHTAVADVACQVTGALAGAWLAHRRLWRSLRRRRFTS
ncbi:MAG: hypothetical protein GEV10_14225 [Streptosporangiales bacterium]|nr:hypothetical protein [Streptosporangiales bacterium]